MNELLLIIAAALELAKLANGIAAQAAAEGREPTPEELARVKASQADAEARWASLLP